ncbi:MAG: DsbA oxidoreductase [uncultured bacterium]|nr:MAG: DsbA oxidoreductase [uncultured bacterium]HBD05447.1 hypothetical protein [Candidatus Uhrbacteria bacterium]
MQRNTRTIIFFIFIFAIIIIFFWLTAREQNNADDSLQNSNGSNATEPSVTFIDPSRGDKDAPVTIVEFGDYSCAACIKAHETISALLANDAKNIRFVWKDIPIDNFANPLSSRAAQAARCADKQGKFWKYHDELFALRGNFSESSFESVASALKLDMESFSACLESEQTLPIINKVLEEAKALNIFSVPTFFINGTRIEQSPDISEWNRLIEQTN